MDIVQIKPDAFDPNAFFDRSTNPISWPMVSIIGGNKSALYNFVSAGELVAGLSNKLGMYVPASYYELVPEPMRTELTKIEEDAGEAKRTLAEAFDNAALSLVGLGLELTSTMQIALEEALSRNSGLTILAGESARALLQNKSIAERDNTLLIVSTASLMKIINALKIPIRTTAERGVFQLADLAQALLTAIPKLELICYSDEEIVHFTHTNPEYMYRLGLGAANIPEHILEATMAALLSDTLAQKNLTKRIEVILQFLARIVGESEDFSVAEIIRQYKKLSY